VIELGQFREAPAFRNHQADNVLPTGFVNLADEKIDEALPKHGGRDVGFTYGLEAGD
jgi:hypothetical protein